MKKYKKEDIKQLLLTNDKAVERGILRIFEAQTADEQDVGDTKHRNGVGFTGSDAHLGTYMAKWLLEGNHLDNGFLEGGRKMIQKYAGQLTKIANSMAKRAERDAEIKTNYNNHKEGCRCSECDNEYTNPEAEV